MKYLEVCLQTSIFAPLFNRKRISLDYGVMVAQQVLVLFVQVRILVVQQFSIRYEKSPLNIQFDGLFSYRIISFNIVNTRSSSKKTIDAVN